MTFAESNFRPAQQGQLDGFCGVYSIVNFILRREGLKSDSDDAKAIFKRLIFLLKEQQKLTPHRICDGFREGQLQKSFNRLAAERGLKVKAHALKSYAKKTGAKLIQDILVQFEPDEAAMVRVECNHWVLAHSSSKKSYIIDDSFGEPAPVKMTVAKTKNCGIGLSTGLVFTNVQYVA